MIEITMSANRTSQILAPEDIAVGDYVALLQISYELPSFLWCDGAPAGTTESTVRISCIPHRSGVPLKVKAVCLPFLLVKSPGRKPRTIDVRKCRLARLDAGYAKTAWRALKLQRRRK